MNYLVGMSKLVINVLLTMKGINCHMATMYIAHVLIKLDRTLTQL